MKKELIFLTIILVSSVIFFSLRGRVQRNTLTTNGQVNSTIVPTIIQEEEFATEIPLTITEPTNKSVVTTTNIVVAGKTAPNAEVLIDDIELKADSQGNFRTSLLLDIGNNIISIIANDALGNYSEIELIVELKETAEEPPQ